MKNTHTSLKPRTVSLNVWLTLQNPQKWSSHMNSGMFGIFAWKKRIIKTVADTFSVYWFINQQKGNLVNYSVFPALSLSLTPNLRAWTEVQRKSKQQLKTVCQALTTTGGTSQQWPTRDVYWRLGQRCCCTILAVLQSEMERKRKWKAGTVWKSKWCEKVVRCLRDWEVVVTPNVSAGYTFDFTVHLKKMSNNLIQFLSFMLPKTNIDCGTLWWFILLEHANMFPSGSLFLLHFVWPLWIQMLYHFPVFILFAIIITTDWLFSLPGWVSFLACTYCI